MDWQLATLSAVRATSAACAGILMLYAYRAHRRTHSRALRWLAIASLSLFLGFLTAGALYQSTGDLLTATLVEAPFTLAALLMMMLSLFGRDIARGRPQTTERGEPDGGT